MKTNLIISFGEILWDMLPGGRQLGGAPFNFAYRAHSLGSNVRMISRLGYDELGDEALKQASRLGMGVEFIQRDDKRPTGTVDIVLDQDNQPDYTINPTVAYDFIEIDDEMLKQAAKADCLCFGALAQRNHTSQAALWQLIESAPNATKIFDINIRKDCYTNTIIDRSLKAADWLKLNEDEVIQIKSMFGLKSDSIIDLLAEIRTCWGLRGCVATFSDKGALVSENGSQVLYQPGYAVNLVDPCGSGDAFTAAFFHHYLKGAPLNECLKRGNALGALVATCAGATDEIPQDELENFLDTPPPANVDHRFDSL